MADNVIANLGTGGATFRTDDDGTAHWPYTKVAFGADDTQTIVTASVGLPVDIIDVGTGATAANQTTIIGHVDGIEALLTTIDTDTGTLAAVDYATQTTLSTLNGKVTACDTGAVVLSSGTVTTVSSLGASTTGPQKAEDVASAPADVGIPAMAVRKATPADTSGADGDYEFLQMDNGRLWVDASGTTLTVASHAVTNAGTFAVQATLDAETTKVIGTVNVAAAQTIAVTNAGTFATQATLDAETTKVIGTVNVAAAQTIATTNAGTFATQVDGDALTALQLIDNPVVAHDAAASGSTGVSMIGLEARTSDYGTPLGNADASRGIATSLGKQVVYPFALPASTWSYASPAAVTDTADDEAKASPASAGTRHYITGVQVINSDDTVGTAVVIKSATTVIWQGWAEQTGGGCSAFFNPPLRGGDNEAINVANVTNASSTFFNLQGYTAEE